MAEEEEAERTRNESQYSSLTRATLEIDFLSGNSTVHPNLFSALAELADNAHDANATSLNIDITTEFDEDGEEENTYFEILDNGEGMSHADVLKIVRFGYSDKKGKEKIGRYGSGYKTGSYFIGTEILMLTKKDGEHTAMLISSKFHKEKRLKTFFVPCPRFDPYMSQMAGDDTYKHELECQILRDYAPLGKYRCGLRQRLKELFDRIEVSGTLIVIGELKRTAIGLLTFSMAPDGDITLDGDGKEEWETSLRSYLEILYANPRMEIILRGQRVEQRCPFDGWIAPAVNRYSGKKIRGALQDTLKETKRELEFANTAYNNASMDVNNAQRGDMRWDREARSEHRAMAKKQATAKEAAARLEQEVKNVQAELAIPHQIDLQMGVNVMARPRYGVSFYLNNRLIIPYYKAMSVFSRGANIGVSMVVCMTYTHFLPTQNKQHFENIKDFEALVRKCNMSLIDYVKYLENDFMPIHLERTWNEPAWRKDDDALNCFWQKYGYPSGHFVKDLPKRSNAIISNYHKTAGFIKKCGFCAHWTHYPDSAACERGLIPKTNCASKCTEKLHNFFKDIKILVEQAEQYRKKTAASRPVQQMSGHRQPERIAKTNRPQTVQDPPSPPPDTRRTNARRTASRIVPTASIASNGAATNQLSDSQGTRVQVKLPPDDDFLEPESEIDMLANQARRAEREDVPSMSSSRMSSGIQRSATKRVKTQVDSNGEEEEEEDEEWQEDQARAARKQPAVRRTETLYSAGSSSFRILSAPSFARPETVPAWWEAHCQNIVKIAKRAEKDPKFLPSLLPKLPRKKEDVFTAIRTIAGEIP